MWASRFMRDCLVTIFCSSSVRRLIILWKLGDIGWSNLAAIRMQMVDKMAICYLGKFLRPKVAMYRSKMLAARNRVSILYSFFSWRSMRIYIP